VPGATVPPKLEQWGAQVLGALPPRVQVRLSGKPPVRIHGDTLAPEAQLLLTVLDRRREPPLETLSPADAREARRRLTAAYAGKPAPVGTVEDLEIDRTVSLRARHYSPPEPGGPHPLLVYYHGGGFTYGDLDTHDGVCRVLCRHSGSGPILAGSASAVTAPGATWPRSCRSSRPVTVDPRPPSSC
jgi:acetyl esterase